MSFIISNPSAFSKKNSTNNSTVKFSKTSNRSFPKVEVSSLKVTTAFFQAKPTNNLSYNLYRNISLRTGEVWGSTSTWFRCWSVWRATSRITNTIRSGWKCIRLLFWHFSIWRPTRLFSGVSYRLLLTIKSSIPGSRMAKSKTRKNTWSLNSVFWWYAKTSKESKKNSKSSKATQFPSATPSN